MTSSISLPFSGRQAQDLGGAKQDPKACRDATIHVDPNKKYGKMLGFQNSHRFGPPGLSRSEENENFSKPEQTPTTRFSTLKEKKFLQDELNRVECLLKLQNADPLNAITNFANFISRLDTNEVIAFYLYKVFGELIKDSDRIPNIRVYSKNLMLLTVGHLFNFIFNLINMLKKFKKEFLLDAIKISHYFINSNIERITGDNGSWFSNLRTFVGKKLEEKFIRTSKTQEISKEIQNTQLKSLRTSENQEFPNKIQNTQLNGHKKDASQRGKLCSCQWSLHPRCSG
jgi:hypothetical protein